MFKKKNGDSYNYRWNDVERVSLLKEKGLDHPNPPVQRK